MLLTTCATASLSLRWYWAIGVHVHTSQLHDARAGRIDHVDKLTMCKTAPMRRTSHFASPTSLARALPLPSPPPPPPPTQSTTSQIAPAIRHPPSASLSRLSPVKSTVGHTMGAGAEGASNIAHGGGVPGSAGPLGVETKYPTSYDTSILHPIPRALGRGALNIAQGEGSSGGQELPFVGEDCWNCYEASWLDASKLNRPRRVWLEIRVAVDTPNISESKSLKLYLNSLNFHSFKNDGEAVETIRRDLHGCLGGKEPPHVAILPHDTSLRVTEGFECIDDEEVDGFGEFDFSGEPDVDSLVASEPDVIVEERLVSHLLRTLCPVTSQPDWGSLYVTYRGPKISRAGLLRYVCSLRKETGFHENAVESAFLAIMRRCAPQGLTVRGMFLRRGGIDICPVRCTPGWDDAAKAIGAPQTRAPFQ